MLGIGNDVGLQKNPICSLAGFWISYDFENRFVATLQRWLCDKHIQEVRTKGDPNNDPFGCHYYL